MKEIKFAVAALCLTAFSFSHTAQTPCENGMADGYPCHLIDLMRFMPLSEIGGGSLTNDIWGYKSPQTGVEYALVGCHNGTAFVSLADPANPVFIGLLPTHTSNSLWRDVETRGHYAFIVSEASGHGLQVFDMDKLDLVTNPPVTFTEDAHYNGFGNSHTLNIDQQSGYLYAMGTGFFSGGLFIVDINDPLNPTLAGGYSEGGYTHDGFALTYYGPDADYQGRELVMACNGYNGLYVVDVTDKSDPQQVFHLTYPDLGYTHQGWFTKDYGYFLMDDELDEGTYNLNQRTHVFDVHDLDNVQYMGFYQSNLNTIDHNLYVLDQFVYESNYTSGVRVLDASKVASNEWTEVAYFDVLPNNGLKEFKGTWSCYPYLPSGLLLATSMYEGFFVLKPTFFTLDQSNWSLCGDDQISIPLTIHVELYNSLTAGVSGLPGAVVAESNGAITTPGNTVITLSGLNTVPPGSYDFNLLLTTAFGTSYELPLHIDVAGNTPIAPLPSAPAQGEVFMESDNIVFSWNNDPNIASYHFQLATDAAFSNMVDEATVNTNSYDPLFNLPEGVYFWRVKSLNDCGESAYFSSWSFTVLVSSVNDYLQNGLAVFPNPTEGVLQIVSNNVIGSITIYNNVGEPVLVSNQLNSAVFSIDLEILPSGLYMLKCDNQIKRIVKE